MNISYYKNLLTLTLDSDDQEEDVDFQINDLFEPYSTNGGPFYADSELVNSDKTHCEAGIVSEFMDLSDDGIVSYHGRIWQYANFPYSDDLQKLEENGIAQYRLIDTIDFPQED